MQTRQNLAPGSFSSSGHYRVLKVPKNIHKLAALALRIKSYRAAQGLSDMSVVTVLQSLRPRSQRCSDQTMR